MKCLQSDDTVYEFVCTWYGSVNRFCDHCVALYLPTNEKRCSGNFMKLMVWFWWQVSCISCTLFLFPHQAHYVTSLCPSPEAAKGFSEGQQDSVLLPHRVQGNIHGAKTVNLEKSGDMNGTRIKKQWKKTPAKLHLLLLPVRQINSGCVREKEDHKCYFLQLSFLCFRSWSFSFSALSKVRSIVSETELYWGMREVRRQKPATIAQVNLRNRDKGTSYVHKNHETLGTQARDLFAGTHSLF